MSANIILSDPISQRCGFSGMGAGGSVKIAPSDQYLKAE